MLANIQVQTNLLHSDTYQESLKHISAMEMYSIRERCGLLIDGSMFAGGGTWPGAHQQKEWDAHFFWGDARVGMHNDKRSAWPVTLFNQGSSIRADEELDEETLFEMLWVAWRSAQQQGPRASEALQKQEQLMSILARRDPNLTKEILEERLIAVSPTQNTL